MKKKVIAFMLAMCMTFTVTACGGVAVNNKEIAVITFDGEAYDLSEDFQNVVVKMTENVCYVMEMDILHRGNAMECPIIVDQYESYVDFGCTFETADGITKDSDAEDLKALKGYTPCRGLYRADSEAFWYNDGLSKLL